MSCRAGRDALGEAVAGVEEAMAARKPSHGSWSILDCVEHMVASERYLLTRLHAAEHADQPFEKSRREGKIARLAADRSRRIEAPEQAHPKGRFMRCAERSTGRIRRDPGGGGTLGAELHRGSALHDDRSSADRGACDVRGDTDHDCGAPGAACEADPGNPGSARSSADLTMSA